MRCRMPPFGSCGEPKTRAVFVGAGSSIVLALTAYSSFESTKKSEQHEDQRQTYERMSPLSHFSHVLHRKDIPSSVVSVTFPETSSITQTPQPSACRCEDVAATNSTNLVTKPTKSQVTDFFFSLARRGTKQKLESTSTRVSVGSKYDVNWTDPLGKGSFGSVFRATDRATGEAFALKQMSKHCTEDVSVQREMNALLHIRAHGNHPNICGLHEIFDEERFYYLVLDLISGGEMFNQLASSGPYSEADAARLMREVASALAFLHGIGVVHCDIKPENLMLSTNSTSNAVIKLVDFGCAEVMTAEDEGFDMVRSGTPAYCPPEALDASDLLSNKRRPPFDMWSLGIVLYIMLTGAHPFDLTGKASDEKIVKRILRKRPPPLRDSPLTAHLSDSAIDLIERLIAWDPKKRISAIQMLQHPWVRGETASHEIMANSDKKLSFFRKFRSQVEARVFADMVSWSDDGNGLDSLKNKSLIHRSFDAFDSEKKGFLTSQDLSQLSDKGKKDEVSSPSISDDEEAETDLISLSDFDGLLSKNMKSKYFEAGDVIYKEGDIGNHMYFINSGTVEIQTGKGFKIQLKQGDFFGQGALLHPKKIRSVTVKCVTPVHVLEISKENFQKYLSSSESSILSLRETDKSRKGTMAKRLLSLQKNLRPINVNRGEHIYDEGQEGGSVYILDEGRVDIRVQDRTAFSIEDGDVLGLHALITGRRPNSTAVCVSDVCKLREMKANDYHNLIKTFPLVGESLRDIWRRRQFKTAVVHKTNKPFTSKELRDAFNAVDEDSSGTISKEEIRKILKLLDTSVSEDEVREVLESLDLNESGSINFDELKRIFGVNGGVTGST